MPASFPSSLKSFVTREIGDTIAASHINDLQLEVAAIESDLLNATPTFLSTVTSGINATALSTGTVPLARLASANTTANGIVDTTTQSFAGGKTFSGVMTITGAATLSNTLGVTGATTLSNTLAVTGATTLSSTVATGALTVTGAATVSTTLGVTGALSVSGAISSATSVALTGVTNNLGTITSGVWNAGAVTSSGAITALNGFSYLGQTFAGYGSTPAGAVSLQAYTNNGAMSNGFGPYIGFSIRDNVTGPNEIAEIAAVMSNASKTSGSLTFSTASAGVLTERMRLSEAGLLTVSGFGTHSFSAGGTNANEINVRNTTAGAANMARISLGNDNASDFFQLRAMSSTFTPSADLTASGATVRSEGAGGLNLSATHASGKIRFYSGGTAERGGFTSSGSFYVGPAGSETVQLTAGGSVVASFPGSSFNIAAVSAFTNGTISYYSSDRRLKKNIEPIGDGLAIVRQLRPSTFDLIADDYHAAGFIAQDVLGLVPGAATVTPNDGLLAFNVTGIVAFTAKAIQELDQQVTQHDTRLAVLEAKLLAAGV